MDEEREEELEVLRSIFSEAECQVAPDGSRVTFCVKAQSSEPGAPDDGDAAGRGFFNLEAVASLALAADYPVAPPLLTIVSSKGLDDVMLESLRNCTAEVFEAMAEQPVLYSVQTAVQERLQQLQDAPPGDCAICCCALAGGSTHPLDGDDELVRLGCLHCLHVQCFCRSICYVEEQRKRAPALGKDGRPATPLTPSCPVCRAEATSALLGRLEEQVRDARDAEAAFGWLQVEKERSRHAKFELTEQQQAERSRRMELLREYEAKGVLIDEEWRNRKFKGFERDGTSPVPGAAAAAEKRKKLEAEAADAAFAAELQRKELAAAGVAAPVGFPPDDAAAAKARAARNGGGRGRGRNCGGGGKRSGRGGGGRGRQGGRGRGK